MDKFCVNKKLSLYRFFGSAVIQNEQSECGILAEPLNDKSEMSHSDKFRRTGKSAFSLAETMVVMVIVAILMAVAAPLVAKKMSNDSKRLISTDVNGQQVYVAAGSEQVLSVGSNNKKDLKLKVNGNTEMNGDLTIVNKPSGDEAVNMILTADGIKTKPTSGDEQYLFQINPTTRETNIEIAIPDYSKMKEGTDKPVRVTENGFVYVINSLKGFKYQNSTVGLTIAEIVDSSTLNDDTSGMIVDLTPYQDHFNIDSTDVYVATRLPLLVPVSKDTYFQCLNNPISIYRKEGFATVNVNPIYMNNNNPALVNNKCYFIPLAKARATTISE